MTRSTVMFIVGAALGMPACVVDTKALPDGIKTAWLAAMLLCAAVGVALWSFDRE